MGTRVKGEASTVVVNDTVFLDIQMDKVGTPNSANDNPAPEVIPNGEK
tara:strand:+ start:369 stop:512 length:144 start_codon:yes stop_codon:yes gene_type:complete